MSKQQFCAVMLFVGNTYKVGHNTFNKDKPSIVARDVYEYIKKVHYSHFRFWEQDTEELTPEILSAHGIIIEAPTSASGGMVSVQDIAEGRKTPAPAEFGKAPEMEKESTTESAEVALSKEEQEVLAARTAKHAQLSAIESEAVDASTPEPVAVAPEDVAQAFKDPGVDINKAVEVAAEELATDAPVGSTRKRTGGRRSSSKKEIGSK